ncbi:MAG: response regulator transcription factor [Rubellimicrobium sp.]|nr:response regulator transcription factor [Rubellimicrobium sp.]
MGKLLVSLIDTIGSPQFYDRLLDFVSNTVSNDLAALVRYSRSGPPDLIVPRIKPTPAMESYTKEFYLHDPFHLHWTTTGLIGVFHLREIAPAIGGTRYAREFLSEMRIHDEIAVFLPPLGEAAPTLILDRAETGFTRADVARINALFPLLAAVQRRHLEYIVLSGGNFGLSAAEEIQALRIVDQIGRVVYVTQPWRKLEARGLPKLASLIERFGDTGPCVSAIDEGLIMKRTRLPSDFGAAPGGFCDEILPEVLPRGMPMELPEALAEKLTPRERDVARLTLRGYPGIEIARRLGLSRGTVKNHRAAIYRKLDITTERELFGEYLRAFGTASTP